MTEEQHNSIKDRLLSDIESGKVGMRPKWHFFLRAALLLLGVVLASLALLYVVSFTVFVLRENGALFAAHFGLRGIHALLLGMPLIFILLAIIFIGILEVLVRKYEFAYRRPLTYSVLGITLLLIIGGIIIDRVHVHQSLFRQAQENRLPIGGGLYTRMHAGKRATVGIIRQQISNNYRVEGHHKETIFVIVTEQTLLPVEPLRVQDIIMVLGPREGNVVRAQGVRKLDKDTVLFAPPRPPKHWE